MRDEPYAFGHFTAAFLEELSTRLAGLRVLEVFAGNGRLAAGLAQRGVAIRATSLFSGYDGHDRGLHHPVEDLDALAAVIRYGGESDALHVSWPTVTEAILVVVVHRIVPRSLQGSLVTGGEGVP